MLGLIIGLAIGISAGFLVFKIFGSAKRKTPTVPEQFQEFMEATQPLLELSQVIGWPKEWLICPACAQQSWIIPPHLFTPCPLLTEMADSTGLKLDAERMTALRAGTAMERQWEMLGKMFEELQDQDDDET